MFHLDSFFNLDQCPCQVTICNQVCLVSCQFCSFQPNFCHLFQRQFEVTNHPRHSWQLWQRRGRLEAAVLGSNAGVTQKFFLLQFLQYFPKTSGFSFYLSLFPEQLCQFNSYTSFLLLLFLQVQAAQSKQLSMYLFSLYAVTTHQHKIVALHSQWKKTSLMQLLRQY